MTTRLYIMESVMDGPDPAFGPVLSNSLPYLMQERQTARLCRKQVMETDGRVLFACHLDGFGIGSCLIRLDVRLYSEREEPLAAVRLIAELLSEPFSLCILPALNTKYGPFDRAYRIVNVEPADVRVACFQSEVEDMHGNGIPCRSIEVARRRGDGGESG